MEDCPDTGSHRQCPRDRLFMHHRHDDGSGAGSPCRTPRSSGDTRPLAFRAQRLTGPHGEHASHRDQA